MPLCMPWKRKKLVEGTDLIGKRVYKVTEKGKLIADFLTDPKELNVLMEKRLEKVRP